MSRTGDDQRYGDRFPVTTGKQTNVVPVYVLLAFIGGAVAALLLVDLLVGRLPAAQAAGGA
ncbi:MAG: hypothetical protein KAI25_07575, partial [Hyphomicrobiaceae bacterium]|nr:hypothetical protein [Hyphomicrobiaceae bacterium]